MFDGVEANQALEHDDGTRLSVVAGPAAQACQDPGGECERASGMRIFLARSLAFEVGRDRFESEAIFRVEGVLQRALTDPVALADQLQHGRGGDQARRNQFSNGPSSAWRNASTLKPLVFSVRNSCSMVQRWR